MAHLIYYARAVTRMCVETGNNPLCFRAHVEGSNYPQAMTADGGGCVL